MGRVYACMHMHATCPDMATPCTVQHLPSAPWFCKLQHHHHSTGCRQADASWMRFSARSFFQPRGVSRQTMLQLPTCQTPHTGMLQGIKKMRASCKLAAEVLEFAGTIVKPGELKISGAAALDGQGQAHAMGCHSTWRLLVLCTLEGSYAALWGSTEHMSTQGVWLVQS